MWECGLKPDRDTANFITTESLLMWECGLKLYLLEQHIFQLVSLLMWECGLKLGFQYLSAYGLYHSLCGSVD